MFAAVIDIGVPGKSLGWAAEDSNGARYHGVDVGRCIALVAQEIEKQPVAMGFEAPMWIPTRLDPTKLTTARAGETGPGLAPRPFSASVGATVLVTGMVVVTYVLRQLRALAPNALAQLDWRAPPKKAGEILLWEAFVTNQKKSHDSRHVEDAQLALTEFLKRMSGPKDFCSDVNEPDCLNLLGAAMLKSGWTKDLSVLEQACLVVRTK